MQVLQELLEVVCPELRRIAGTLMRRERPGHLLRPTALVNEAFLRLFNGQQVPFEDSHEFFAASVRHMRRVLTDYARTRLAQKRQEHVEGVELRSDPLDVEVIDLERALDTLREEEPRAAEIVELKFYAGLSIQEIAAVLDTSPRTIVREWEWARAWLYRYLTGAAGDRFTPLPIRAHESDSS